MALLIAQPISIETKVSKNSYLNCFLIIFSSCKFHCLLCITSECRNKLCGITTAPNTLIIISIEPLGKVGVTQPKTALFQSICTNESSYKNDNPITDTNAIIHFSIILYELV